MLPSTFAWAIGLALIFLGLLILLALTLTMGFRFFVRSFVKRPKLTLLMVGVVLLTLGFSLIVLVSLRP